MQGPSSTHASRRSPAAPTGPLDLHAAASELLEQAATMNAGRAARTLTPGAGAPLTQTLIALIAGRELQEHDAPGPATLQVLAGTGVLTAGETTVELTTGRWAIIPPRSHSLKADGDLVVLLTVTPHRSTPAA
jgi:quercetin dioxygenase-like cupin family protein